MIFILTVIILKIILNIIKERGEKRMPYTTKINSIVLILFLALFVCILILQIYLSGKKSPWPGLLLPLFALLWAVVRMFMARYFRMTAAEIAGVCISEPVSD